MINVLMTLMVKADNKQEERDYVGREVGIPRENQNEMVEFKNTVTEVKNAFDLLILGLDTAEERISELEHMTIETSKTKKQR